MNGAVSAGYHRPDPAVGRAVIRMPPVGAASFFAERIASSVSNRPVPYTDDCLFGGWSVA